ncbi:MAG: serine/threonine-protein kinase [Planctomycetaceae bacterium]|nr:serine/threonine-protein kinase [Planctomycetaceae bacterium]
MSKRMIGPFELGERVGTGGMGVVYRATYTKTGMACAIKVLSPDVNESPQVQARFEREIAILKKLQHPHIVRYFGGGKVGTQRFYAMELVTGGSLDGYLKKKGKVPWEEALGFTRQIAEALEHAHTAGVIHRDLKPANLLMTPDGKVKLTDFGIARDTTATALTAAGKTVGTYAYMAPEQIRGKPPVDRRTDLYALGCVLFEMLTGEPPFDSENAGELLVKHLQEEPPRLTSLSPDVPIWLEELVFRLMEKDPDERIFDALALQVALDDIKDKVSRQASLVGSTLGGGVTKTAGADGETKLGTGKKKRKKKSDKTPLYEQLWFLATALTVVVGLIGWQIQRALYPSEAALFARAQALMSKEDSTYWIDAKNKHLPELLRRFPNGKYAPEAQTLLDKAEMHFAEQQALNRKGREPTSEGERLLIQANKFLTNEIGDRVSALEVFESMVELLANRPEERVYVLLAKQKIEQITKEGGDKLDRVQLIEDALRRADESADAGRTFEARTIWNSVVTLYKDNQELETLVERAKDRLEETRRNRKSAE